MSAPPGPRGSRGFRPSARARGTFVPRPARPRSEDRPSGGRSHSNASESSQTRAQPGSGPTRAVSRRGTRNAPSQRTPIHRISNVSGPAVTSQTSDARRDATNQEPTAYRAYMEKTYTTLDEQRKHERKYAIQDGLLADPDRPTTLANAITIVGICQDMCAEHERVQRIVQLMVDDCEKVPHATRENTKVPLEDRMVKRYRRPAAGYEEQLPSDIRPPAVLQKTLDYLMDELVGGQEPLANVHKFVWDRTRAIRNDFSIQQVTKVDELRIAISCFERIARFHILSLHQLAKASESSVDFDAYQEREQLNNTLLSLMYYYDDSRHKLISPNEPEFRAYCIIFEIQDQRPDLEDRAQDWPPEILRHAQVQTALKLYAAAANSSDAQGPLRPQAPNAIAQANSLRFFAIVQSPAVPYLMACVAEIYFNKIRRTALDTIWRVYKVKRGGKGKVEDWMLSDVAHTLGFDDEDEAQTYCEDHGLTVSEKENGEAYVDLGSVIGRYLSDANANRKQAFSANLVEQKRHGRTFPAVVNGLTAAQAQAQGYIVDDSPDNDDSTSTNNESLFLPDRPAIHEPASQPVTNGADTQEPPKIKEKIRDGPSGSISFLQPSAKPFSFSDISTPNTSTANFFGRPSISTSSQPTTQPFSTGFNIADKTKNSPFDEQSKPEAASSPFSKINQAVSKSPSFNFAKPFTEQAQSSFNPTTSSTSSHFSVQPPSTSDSPSKVNFGASPLFNFPGQGNAIQAENSKTNIDISTNPNLTAAESKRGKQKDMLLESFNSNPASNASTSTHFPSAPTLVAQKDTNDKSSPLSFPPSGLASAASSLPSNTSTERLVKPAHPHGIRPNQPSPPSSIRSSTRPSESSFSQQPNNVTEPRKQSPFQPPTDVTKQTFQPSAFSVSASQPQPPIASSPKPAATETPDPRPAVLDALAEGLLMEDQGLLQQFIEYTIGPIVHEAFHEVEEERSWQRARKIRTVLLSKKYLQRWRDIVWKRKLMRKGKERRAIFAQSMREMAKSSRQRHNQSQASFDSSSAPGQDREFIAATSQARRMSPPSPPRSRSNGKRKSLPAELKLDDLPDADSNKRERQEAPGETKHIKHSLGASFRPHHERSRTMGDSREPGSHRDSVADFSQLDETTYLNDKIVRQAKRLAGQAKLDSTRGDYFALKARGVDPDAVYTPKTGVKRSRIDEQIERVRKMLKPSPPNAKQPTPGPKHLSSSGPSDSNVQPDSTLTNARDSNSLTSPNDLIAQVRRVREALAEDTAWMQSEREKSERLSSSRSSEVANQPAPAQPSFQSSQRQTQDHRPHEWNATPTRAQVRLETTRANGFLPPDWDWNKSVTEWKLRGCTGSPRPGASREQSASTTPGTGERQSKKSIGLAAVPTDGLDPRKEPAKDGSSLVYDDDEESPDCDEDEEEGYEDEGGDYANGNGVEYEGEYDDEFEGEDEEEEEEEDMGQPERVVLKAQGNSADTAIDLD
ncbi:MAG: hypothetical protein LQ341_000803 [Variospora aurantia]|nr:MAG: hypothetical protein LQ341_000803 [Variospora aurantia]